ncbi:hypothetical protein DPMN_061427 [Dreissena polymorpha]|uniref:Uncharacterized protein n=1 Tax=Dreissena polymorpha TaxID=45954 RepID=A0A9D4C7Q9_DREPO|nr:hypothetical protein DPMN_061427 [Dreissena polymorpha]
MALHGGWYRCTSHLGDSGSPFAAHKSLVSGYHTEQVGFPTKTLVSTRSTRPLHS